MPPVGLVLATEEDSRLLAEIRLVDDATPENSGSGWIKVQLFGSCDSITITANMEAS